MAEVIGTFASDIAQTHNLSILSFSVLSTVVLIFAIIGLLSPPTWPILTEILINKRLVQSTFAPETWWQETCEKGTYKLVKYIQ